MLSGLLCFLDDGIGVFALSLVVAGFVFYFLPCIVASARKVANGMAGIVLLDLFLGWTLIGWLAALIWACTAETRAQAQLREMAYAQLAHGAYPAQWPQPPAPQQSSSALSAGRALGNAFGRFRRERP